MNRSTHNGRLAVQMEDAHHCLADLAKRGLSIRQVEVGLMPIPRIILDASYLELGGLKGGIKCIKRNGIRTDVYATQHQRCQIEWEVPA
ncbi:hypothetical protein [Candidatus Vondammii sp. HM_W22]|uniref:hypothetical protein n=1 Tax=Candidatus Vondammii sp. HM_W22 TaxID=2687299 RepID=UPI001F14199E|nr:hypothetical protein [Candidatus Vondammii sp. HM_W22]